ncbi:hypothetical protein LTR64_007065 [Lithohypha guttulata]|uniref:uncharacterized protein n=1 Tax=Lithohypha guttulata TaxID=1690604 RepID=UPI002DDEBF87|nr:hypothetical protein LTR51_004379 [Lithohypha guttulata]
MNFIAPTKAHSLFVISAILLLTLLPSVTAASETHLNVTALTYRGNVSILQCWSLEPPFVIPESGTGPTGAAVAGLGAVAGNASFIVQGPGSVGGYKNAPRAQWSWFISGLGHITLPESTDEAWIVGGRYGLVFADDVYTSGHYTTFPSKDETVLLGLPVLDGQQPEHEVLHEGACEWEDLIEV